MKLYCIALCFLVLIFTVSSCRKKSETDGHQLNKLRQVLIIGTTLGEVSASNLQAGKGALAFADYTNQLSHVMNTKGLLIKQSRDYSGGWWYDDRTGQVFFNKNEDFYLNDNSWVQINKVDFSKSINIQLSGNKNIYLSDALQKMVKETNDIRYNIRQQCSEVNAGKPEQKNSK